MGGVITLTPGCRCESVDDGSFGGCRTASDLMVTVEKATELDLGSVSDLDALVFGSPPRLEAFQESIDNGACWVAKDGGRLLGFTLFDRFLHGHGFLRVIGVHPEHRRRGVATALISRLEAECPTDRLFTATEESNVDMRRLCDTLGFVRAGHIDDLDEGHDEVIYLKRLSGAG